VPIAGVTATITGWIGDHGLYAVFLLMALDAVLPAASELVMVYGGALAAGAFAGQTVTLFGAELDSTAGAYVAIALAGTLGYLVGAVVGWAIGYYGGHPFLERHGRWLHLPPERMARAEGWFERRGDAAVLIGRILPVVRSFVSIPAGVLEMPLRRYVPLTLVGSAIWCFAFAAVGVAVGESWESFDRGFRYADYVAIALVAVLVVVVIVRAVLKRSRRRAPAET
jgi:membrane protein DedA with SNARE-associated domain